MPSLSALVSRVPWWVIGNPFEAFIALLCVFGGLPLAFGHAQPASIDTLLPRVLQHVWGVFLTFGGLFVLIGVSGGARASRYRFELAGLALLAPAAVVYGICVVKFVGIHGLAQGCLLFVFALSCVFRYALVLRAAAIVRAQQLQTRSLVEHLRELGVK